MTNPFNLIQRAREFAERKKFNVAIEFYEKSITLLEQNLDGSDKSKMELWSTKSELLNFQAGYKKPEETCRNKNICRMCLNGRSSHRCG